MSSILVGRTIWAGPPSDGYGTRVASVAPMAPPRWFSPAVALPALAIACATGCVARVQPAAYVDATYVPGDIETYPHTAWEGRVVYLYGDRWYFHDGPRWAYLREEPPYLYRHRTYVVAAPRV